MRQWGVNGVRRLRAGRDVVDVRREQTRFSSTRRKWHNLVTIKTMERSVRMMFAPAEGVTMNLTTSQLQIFLLQEMA